MYYHALLANNMLAPDEDYQNLKETYVIFLCGFDPFGLGWAVTDYQITANHGNHILGDGTHTLILNAKGDWREVNDELKGIFQLVLKQRATYGHLGLEIARNIKNFKESKAGGRKYMALAGEFWQNVWEDAREEGREEGRKEMVSLFVQKLAKDGQSQTEIMTYLETELGLSEDEAQEYYQLAMTKVKHQGDLDKVNEYEQCILKLSQNYCESYRVMVTEDYIGGKLPKFEWELRQV